ncbi:hypothetical protein OQA88_7058 [Cercophora sp. LCS_1]
MDTSRDRSRSESERDGDAELRRRKVRKGTHSCWECRRRKIKCQFSHSDDTTCLPCQARGSVCRSQEFVDDARPTPPDRRLTQRLGRLEELMSKLVDRIAAPGRSPTGPGAGSGSRAPARKISPTPSSGDDATYQQRLDALEASVADGSLLHGFRAVPATLTPDSTAAVSEIDRTKQALHRLFPSQNDLLTITGSSAAAFYVLSLFCSFRDIIEGKTEVPVDLVSAVPPLSSHPVILAKRLLQLSICMQQLPPGLDVGQLHLQTSIPETMMNIITTVTRLVTSDDDLIGNSEGLECLVLQGLWHANAGSLRKAWMAYRKALNLAQLMGLDRDGRALKSVDPNTPMRQRSSAEGLWYRINNLDRFTSLLLGLAAGSTNNAYATDEAMKRDTDMERLEKLQTVIAHRIIERNAIKGTPQAYTTTQSIDLEMEKLAREMDDDWWVEPVLDPFNGKEHNFGLMLRLFRQTQHFDLQILLHLPYMLRNPDETRYEYSRSACVRASREVLKRFVSFRTLFNAAWSCRHIDYSALVAAMTLLLSYLRQPNHVTPLPPIEERAADRKLIKGVRDRMHHLAVVNQDKLSEESAAIVGQMTTILDSLDLSVPLRNTVGCGSNMLKCLQLNIPYFGTVSIHPSLTAAVNGAAGGLSDDFNMTDTTETTTAFSGGSMFMSYDALDPSLFPTEPMLAGMFMEFNPQLPSELSEFPLTADADDWIFQGVDATYWAMLNESIGPH